MKTCKKCSVEKEIESFYKGCGMKDGLLSVCKTCFLEYGRSEKRVIYARKYRLRNRGRLREKYRDYMREYMKLRRKDKVHRISASMRTALYRSIVNRKGNRKWEEILGYSAKELVKHLEGLFSKDMSWDNYGSYWEVDHIKPISSFSYFTKMGKEFAECWSLSNLRPLEIGENRRRYFKE